jgi:hypothetical protein
MTPQLAALIIQVLLKYGPSVAQAITEILHKQDPTLEDWNKVFALSRKTYDDYVAVPPPTA